MSYDDGKTPRASTANRRAYMQDGSGSNTGSGTEGNRSEDADFRNAGQTGVELDPTSAAAQQRIEAATIEAIAQRIPRLRDTSDPFKLTPLRAHYLKKALVKLEVDRELDALARKDALSLLGPPFRPSQHTQQVSLPILRFLFHHFILTFPFLRSTPPNFFADKVQVFVERFLEKNISGTDDRDETTKRKKLGGKASKWTVLLMGAAIHVKGGDGAEEILKIADVDRGRLFAAHEKRQQLQQGSSSGSARTSPDAEAFDVNVIGVRTKYVKKGRLSRTRAHDEFLIRTRRPGGRETFVNRRYGDFARLADTLRIEFPEEEIPKPPAKDRRETDVKSTMYANDEAASNGSLQDPGLLQLGAIGLDDSEQMQKQLPPTPKSAASQTNRSPHVYPADQQVQGSARSSMSESSTRAFVPGPLARERNRLTLRAYIRTLLSNPHVADSEALSSFLLSEPVTLTHAEQDDASAREALDAVRDDEAQRFSAEATRRVTELRHHLQSFKADLIQRDGLTRVFANIRSTPNIEDLPESYRALIAWGRISLASTLFHLFVGSDTASDLFGQLKRIHGLMPYFMLRGILRISNPVSMIRGVLDLFLAQPFGQRSLLQRMLTSSIQEEARELGEMANRIAGKIDDDLLAERIRCFVYAPMEVQEEIRLEAERDRLDIVTVILKSRKVPSYPADAAPPAMLNRNQVHRVVRSSRAYELYKEYRANLGKREVDEGPDAVDGNAWLYEDLHVLLKCLTRLRDKEQLVSLLFEGVTSELLKDIVTIFYSPLAQVYKAANIADSLSDLQTFINDLIKTVEANEELSFTDPQKTVQVFIDLVARHEGRFYAFVHQVHSKGSGLFDGLMHWIELFINFVRGPEHDDRTLVEGAAKIQQRSGIGEVDLEICMPAGGEERRRVLHEIDCIVVHAYRLKLIRELKLKRRMADREVRGAAQRANAGDVSSWGITPDDEDEGAFVSAMAENLGVSDAFTDEVNEVEAEELAEAAEEHEDDDEDDEELSEHYHDDDSESVASATDSAASSESEGHGAPALPGKDGPNGTTDPDEALLSPSKVSGWRPPFPQRSISTLTARAADKELPPVPLTDAKARAAAKSRRRQAHVPKGPTLEAIPDMLPLFIEMVRPLLRPARTASGSSHTSMPSMTSPVTNAHNSQPFALSQPPTRQSEQRQQPPGGWFG